LTKIVAAGSISLTPLSPAIKPLYSATLFDASPIAAPISLTTDLASLETLKAEINQRLTAASNEINTVIANKQGDRGAVVAKIEKPLLDLYEKIRSTSGGVAASALVGNKCNGCNLAINAVEMERIKSLAKDELLRCEECRRILVRI